MMDLPIQVASRISLGLHSGEEVVPDAGFLPAIEPGRDSGRRTRAVGQVGPGRAGPQNPQDTVDDRAMIVVGSPARTAFGGALRWEQGLELLPLFVSYVTSMHARSIPKGLRIRPSILGCGVASKRMPTEQSP